MTDRPTMYSCGNCDWRGNNPPDAKHILSRISPGDIFTDTECPRCGALVHEDDGEEASEDVEPPTHADAEALDRVIAMLEGPAGTLIPQLPDGYWITSNSPVIGWLKELRTLRESKGTSS